MQQLSAKIAELGTACRVVDSSFAVRRNAAAASARQIGGLYAPPFFRPVPFCHTTHFDSVNFSSPSHSILVFSNLVLLFFQLTYPGRSELSCEMKCSHIPERRGCGADPQPSAPQKSRNKGERDTRAHANIASCHFISLVFFGFVFSDIAIKKNGSRSLFSFCVDPLFSRDKHPGSGADSRTPTNISDRPPRTRCRKTMK